MKRKHTGVAVLTVILAATFIHGTFASETIQYMAKIPPSEHTDALGYGVVPEKEDVVEVFASTTSSFDCSCVMYLRSLGLNVRGDAINLQPNIEKPERGDVVILTYRDKHTGQMIGHVAFVETALLGGIWVSERNFIHCEYTERLIEYGDPHIKGFMRI